MGSAQVVARCGLRRTTEISKKEFSKACDIVMHDIYVDDCISGTQSVEET